MKFFRYIFLSLFLISAAFARVWHVSATDTIKTIQTAIDSASSGDSVLVGSAFQNVGPVEIIGKRIALISKGYMNNPKTYNISSGAALYDTLNTLPLLRISSADSTIIAGFLLDKSDVGNGGGILIENSRHVLMEGLHFKANCIAAYNASIELNKTQFYNMDSSVCNLISTSNTVLDIANTIIKNSIVNHVIITSDGSELNAENLSVYDNTCSSELYHIGSDLAYFSFMTSYGNSTPGSAWRFNSTWTSITNSILEFSPPIDIGQCEISYSAVPGGYNDGPGNISLDPKIDVDAASPVLLSTSPCISAANPDTIGIPRIDVLGNPRPNPVWAPPDMGAYESERHMLLNDDKLFWISKEGDDVWGNGSTEYPFASLQSAIDYANEADTLILLPGSYMTNAIIDNKSLTISSPYLFEKDSAYCDSVVLFPDSSLSESILLIREADSVNILGLSMNNGSGREFYSGYTFGGAIYCENSKLDLENLKLSSNHSDYSGGAIYASLGSELLMSDILFQNNMSYFGGALSLSSSTALLNNVIFNGNLASSGGGIYLENSSSLIAYYTELSENIADSGPFVSNLGKATAISQYGGAIFGNTSYLRLHNTLINGNRAVNQGSAIALRYGVLNLVQSTVADNTVDADSAGSIYIMEPSENVIVLNSILSEQSEIELLLNNTNLYADHSLIYGGNSGILSEGSENRIQFSSLIESDPGLDEDYNLNPGSPCLNAGIPSYGLADNYLINYLSSEYGGSAPDLGHLGAQPVVRFELEEIVSSVNELPDNFDLMKIYPNPFNPLTTIDFNLEYPGKTRLSIYNINGKHIVDLVNGNLQNGHFRIKFNAEDLPSGIYVARLAQNNKFLTSQKLLLVK